VTDEIEETEDGLPHVPPVQVERDEDEIEDELHFQICMLLDELHKILDVVLTQWELYRDGKVDVVVPALATNIAIDLVRQAELKFEDVVVRPKKYPEAKIPVWTLPAVAYFCQDEGFNRNPREEWVKPRDPNDLRHPGIYALAGTDTPIGTEDMCFHSVFCGLRVHLSNQLVSPLAVQEPIIDAMRQHNNWP
jgi:hypothetical protein